MSHYKLNVFKCIHYFERSAFDYCDVSRSRQNIFLASGRSQHHLRFVLISKNPITLFCNLSSSEL